MKRIKVKSISLVEKDVIEVENEADFIKLYDYLFKDNLVFDFNGVLYLIGSEVAYFYKEVKR